MGTAFSLFATAQWTTLGTYMRTSQRSLVPEIQKLMKLPHDAFSIIIATVFLDSFLLVACFGKARKENAWSRRN